MGDDMSGYGDAKNIAELAKAVRESTLKRLRLVPEGCENWRGSSEAMSFADMAKHLIDTDEWLFKKLEIKNIEPIKGQAGLVKIENRKQYHELLEELNQTGKRRTALLENIGEEALSEMIYDARYGREVTVWWIIVRGNIDHETHHRGQIAAYLKVCLATG
jgi:uncharacterized damage-inducible protein DinB